MNLNIKLTPDQFLALTVCMLAISNVDGIHPAETALIQTFYESEKHQDAPAFDLVQGMHTQAPALLPKLPTDETFARSLVSLCLMVGYADGTLSDAERSAIEGFARALGLSTVQFEAELQMVRDSLLGALSSLPDAASVAALAKEL